MKALLTILLTILCVFSYSQTDSLKINGIRKIVKAINNDSSYTVKTLLNEYFAEKYEATDGGQELKGYYKKDEVKKLIYTVGLSYCMMTREFYFSDYQLVFVFEKEDDYPAKKDSSGEFIGLDYSKLEPAFEARYYFEKNKLFKTTFKGDKRIANDSEDNKEKRFLNDSAFYITILKNVKNH